MNSFLLSQPSKTQWQGEVLTLDAAAPTLVFQSSFSWVDVWSYLSNAWSEIWTTAQNNAAGLETSLVLGSISLYLTVQMHPRILWRFFYLYPTKWGQISQVLFDLNSERRIWNSFQDTPHPGWGLGGEGYDQCYQLLPKAPGQSLIPSPKRAGGSLAAHGCTATFYRALPISWWKERLRKCLPWHYMALERASY